MNVVDIIILGDHGVGKTALLVQCELIEVLEP
jgi:GTPase SAR1 family protein